MTWNYAYTPHIWPSVFTLIVLIVLALYAWRSAVCRGAAVYDRLPVIHADGNRFTHDLSGRRIRD